RRAEWRPQVDRVGRIDDDAQGRPVWRELDYEEDRFDFRIDAVEPGRHVAIAIAAPDQIGIEGGWDYRIEPDGTGSRVSVTESRRIANPLWRGLFHLTRGSHATVDQELDMLATFLDTDIRIEHR
ncbi:MAG: SRPBCC family protein, partial [Myxococcota bacterium]